VWRSHFLDFRICEGEGDECLQSVNPVAPEVVAARRRTVCAVGKRIGPWALVETKWKAKGGANQGVATVRNSSTGTSQLVFRGDQSVAPDLRAKGWNHIGDPDSWGGAVFDAYQRSDTLIAAKLFRVTTPDNRLLDFQHALVTTPIQELANNSFAAISPDGQWLVSGEWFDMQRFLVFPAPTINPVSPQPGQDLKLRGTINLAQRVRNVQGAVFLDDTTLLCSTDDSNAKGAPSLWGGVLRQLLEVKLAAPLPDTSRPATVECLGPIPSPAPGFGPPEVEGIDYDHSSGDLRIVVVPGPPVSMIDAAVLRFRRVP
jgi:hypothetical protein